MSNLSRIAVGESAISPAPTLVVAESKDVWAEGLARILEERGLTVIELWPRLSAAASAMALDAEPDIVLVGPSLAVPASLPGLERVHLLHPQARIVLLMDGHDHAAIEAMKVAPVHSILLDQTTAGSLELVLRLIASGTRLYPPGHDVRAEGALTIDALPPPEPLPAGAEDDVDPSSPVGLSLSVREAEVLGCLSHGHPNKIIARQLSIAESTVKVHVKAILRKTGARNRTELALLATRPAGRV